MEQNEFDYNRNEFGDNENELRNNENEFDYNGNEFGDNENEFVNYFNEFGNNKNGFVNYLNEFGNNSNEFRNNSNEFENNSNDFEMIFEKKIDSVITKIKKVENIYLISFKNGKIYLFNGSFKKIIKTNLEIFSFDYNNNIFFILGKDGDFEIGEYNNNNYNVLDKENLKNAKIDFQRLIEVNIVDSYFIFIDYSGLITFYEPFNNKKLTLIDLKKKNIEKLLSINDDFIFFDTDSNSLNYTTFSNLYENNNNNNFNLKSEKLKSIPYLYHQEKSNLILVHDCDNNIKIFQMNNNNLKLIRTCILNINNINSMTYFKNFYYILDNYELKRYQLDNFFCQTNLINLNLNKLHQNKINIILNINDNLYLIKSRDYNFKNYSEFQIFYCKNIA